MNKSPARGTAALTRQNLLAAGAQVFAQRGFHGATTREIAQKAGVNLASLHYHFQDKRTLYLAVFKEFLARMTGEHPLPPLTQGPPEERLRAFIAVALRRALQEERPGWSWKLMMWEMSDPTEALEVFIDELSRPMFRVLRGLVREIVGPQATPREVRRCCASMVGQWLVYRFARPMIERVIEGRPVREADLPALAEHIARFSLGGLGAVKRGQAGGGA